VLGRLALMAATLVAVACGHEAGGGELGPAPKPDPPADTDVASLHLSSDRVLPGGRLEATVVNLGTVTVGYGTPYELPLERR
jgi:hypothetical protein